MNTKIIKIDRENFKKDKLDQAAEIIIEGGVVAFPTETVYGLGANGLIEFAVEKIFKAKGRPSDNPLILHIGEIDQLYSLVDEVPDIALDLIDRFWPGPLTIIFKKSDIVPDIITAGLSTVAIRMPENSIAKALINLSGVPIAAPSANISGKPSPTSSEHVIEDMEGKIDLIIDGGDTGIGIESTVLDISGEIPIILRPGGVSYESLKEIVPTITQDSSSLRSDIVPKSPGQKYRHYAPNSEMIVFKGNVRDIVRQINNYIGKSAYNEEKIGIMATDETKDYYPKGIVKSMGTRDDKETIATNLFKTIREFDRLGVDIILAEAVDYDGIGTAIMNRMMKASGEKFIDC